MLWRCVCVFFFFKQKTAYEMRISDWSSDVCSSDLGRRRHRDEMIEAVAPIDVEVEGDRTKAVGRIGVGLVRRVPVRTPLALALVAVVEQLGIGRASCRASVWKYG